MKIFSKINSQITIENTEYNKTSYFYKRMTIIVLQFTVFLISPMFFIGSYFYISTGFLLFGMLEIFVGAFLVFFVYFNPIHYSIKKYVILVIFYLTSIFVLVTTGISGGGMVSLMTTIILINLLIPTYKHTKLFFGINSLVLAVLTVLLYSGLLDKQMIYQYKETWMFLVVLVSIYTLAILYSVEFYKKTLIEQYQLSHNQVLYLNSIMNSINDIIITVNEKGIINYYNQNAINEFFHSSGLLNIKYDEAIGTVSLISLTDEISLNFQEANVITNLFSFESQYQERMIYFTQKMFPIIQNNENVGAVYVFHDITEQYLKEQELTYISFHDQLTKLYNRRFFEVELARLDIARNLPISLIMIDVNGLKLINDSFGHKVGDQLLIEVANSMKEGLRKSEICSRIGGDEFVILLPKSSKQVAINIVDRIQKIAKTKKVNGIDISFAVGIGVKSKVSEDINNVFKVMEDDLYRNKLSESNSIRSKTIDLILTTLYETNNREMKHSKRVSEICEAFAKALKFDQEHISKIRLTGLMHDIGKIAIDEQILNKKSRLSKEEFNRVKKHSEIGYRILSSLSEFNEIAQYVYEHHENWDGTGYPNGKKGEEISLEARIVSIVDSFDAMTGIRTYKSSISVTEAVNELKKCKGSQFDPKLVDFFIKEIIDRKKY